MKFLSLLLCALMEDMTGNVQPPEDAWWSVPALVQESHAADPDIGPWIPSVAKQVKRERMKAPVIESIDAMMRRFEKIPQDQRRTEMLKACKTLREGLDRGVRGESVYATLLTLDMMLGDSISLDRDARAILWIAPQDPAANAALGRLRLLVGDTKLAERCLVRAVKGGGAMAMCDYARVLITKDQYAEAEEWARKAVKAAPKDPTMREPLIAALAEQHQFDAAEAEIKEMLKLATGQKGRPAANFANQVAQRMATLKAQDENPEQPAPANP